MADDLRLFRIFDMILELACPRGMTRKELADRFGISPRQVLRDIDAIKGLGIDVSTVGDTPASGVEKRFCLAENDGVLPTLKLSHDEAFLLTFCLALARRDVPHQDDTYAIEKIRAKLNVLLPQKVAQYMDGLCRLYLPMNRPRALEQYDHRELRFLEEAILNPFWIRFDYTRMDGQTSPRTVAPHAILVRDGRLYLLGNVSTHVNDKPVLFAVSRIANLEIIEDDSEVPEPFPYNMVDPQKVVEESFGLFQEDAIELEAIFCDIAADSVRNNRFHPTQVIEELGDGRVRLTLTACGTKEILWWLLGFGEKVKVVRPESLREEIAGVLEEALAQYRQGSQETWAEAL